MFPSLLLLLAQAAPSDALAVYAYGQDLALRDRLIAAGTMYDDLGGYVLGAAGAGLSLRHELLPPLAFGETLVRVARHAHGEGANLAEESGRALWSAPEGHVSLRALGAAELKAAAAQAFRCHGAFRRVNDRPLQPARFDRGAHNAVTPKPGIQDMVSQVAQANLQAHVNSLVAFGTRRHGQPGEVSAQNWIRTQMQGYGLTTTLFNYDSSADNVIGELPGSTDPGRIVIIGGHYDSVNWAGSSTSPAPGADDDASGVAGVLECARILAQHQWDYTLRFIAWSGEEMGLLGSEAYVDYLDSVSADIVGMVQLDMTGYRQSGDTRDVDFVTNDTNGALNAFAMDVFAAYVPALGIKSGTLSGGTSDHLPFTQHGYPAIFPFEDVGAYSPFIHTASDTVGTSLNDWTLATQITQGALATIAELARPVTMTLTHSPIPDQQSESGPYLATLTAVSQNGESVSAVDLLYRVNGGAWQALPMSPAGPPDQWAAGIPGQPSPAFVDYYLVATDTGGNQAWLPEGFSPGESWYSFVVGIARQIVFNDFEGATDEGWTHTQVAQQDDWARGTPQGKSDDPAAAYSGARCWGNDLGIQSNFDGNYEANVNNRLESPVFDLSGETGVRLRFQRWLNVEDGTYDHARIYVLEAGVWNKVWENPASGDVHDSRWTEFDLDISAFADNNAGARVRFEMVSDGGLEYGGWNLDDFELWSVGPVGGADTILLTGSTSGVVGGTVSYSFSNAPASSPYWIYYSFRRTGTTINGHAFDIGTPFFTATTGTTTGAGTASWTSGPVPARGAGRTVYIEARADQGATTYDSNTVTLQIQ
ncbi:MAG: M20/M25/M40 family metallo-hydrolase [Planctomycetota bacterium]|nr:MAG: M20/M25/M40 family metallo-hydrolase [Planctomycetota bacterium]